MPKTLPIQESFAAGEVSPRLYGRSSVEGYKAGSKSMVNWITTPHGPFFRRNGFKFIDGFAGTYAKVIPFNTPLGDYYVIFTNSNTIYVLEYGDDDVTTIPPTETDAPPWADADIPFIQYVVTPDGNTMYLVHGSEPPMKIVHAAGAFTISEVSFTAPPAAWGAGDYPNTITIFEGRVWFGGSPNHPTNIWASVSGNYENMTTGSSAAASLDFILDRVGQIRWMAGVKKLVLGTQYSEYVLYANDPPMKPDDINYDPQSAYGSAKVQALIIGNTVLYVSADGRKVREVSYNWTEDSWASKDVIFASEHLTKDNKIVELVFAQNPDYLLVARTENNTILMATYDRGNSIVGWHRHTFTGTLHGLCAMNDDATGKDVLVVVFNRGVVASQLNFEEYGTSFLDCYHEITNAPASVDITGLVELAGETVGVLTDGAVHPDITLDGSGNGTLQWPTEKVIIGFNYVATQAILPLAKQTSFGSTAPMMKKWSQIYVKIINSAFPKIDGTRPPSRYPATLQGEVEALKSTDIRVTSLGWSRTGEITITQELPLETMIAAIYGETTEEIL